MASCRYVDGTNFCVFLVSHELGSLCFLFDTQTTGLCNGEIRVETQDLQKNANKIKGLINPFLKEYRNESVKVWR